MERNKAATSVTSDEMDTALHGAARQNIKWDACISGNFHAQPPPTPSLPAVFLQVR